MPGERPPESIEGKRARLARALQRRARETIEAPLSFGQEQVWLADQLDRGSPLFNVTLSARVRGALSEGFLRRAAASLAARHESLRTTFAVRDGVPVQRIAPSVAPDLLFLDARELPGDGVTEKVERFVRAQVHTRFDLAEGPLLRMAMVRLAAEDHLVCFTAHHIVADGWSVHVLLQEVGALYAREIGASIAPLPPLALQPRDLARQERERLKGDALDRLLDFWRRQLDGAPQTLDLPGDWPDVAHPSPAGDVHRFLLPAALGDAVRDLARVEQATPFMTLFAGLAALLFRCSGQDDLLIGVPMSGRDRPETLPMVGLFANIVLVRVRPRADLTFRALLSQVRASVLASLAHQEVPFHRLAEALRPTRAVGRKSLVQVIHLHQAFPRLDSAPGLDMEFWEVHPGFSRFELGLRTEAEGDGFACQFEYSTDLYRRETVAGLARDYQGLLEAVVARPDLPLGAPSRVGGRIGVDPAPRPRVPVVEDLARPATGTEQALATLWKELLGLRDLGIHDDFFAVGGNSLMAMQLVEAMRERWPVDVLLYELFEEPTVAHAARLIDAATKTSDAARSSVPRTPPGVPQPLSFSQEMLWLLEQFEPRTAFNILVGARLTGPLDRVALERALTEVVRRHEVLRSVLVVREGRPTQVARPLGDLPLDFHDLGDLDPTEASARATALAEKLAGVRFDTAGGCLIRFLLVRTAAGQHTLFAAVHHMALDGWSIPILWREAAAHYEAFRDGGPSPLPELPIQFADWACWQRRYVAPDVARQTAFWLEKLRGPIPALDLPTDLPRASSMGTEPGVCPLDIPAAIAGPLLEIGRRAQATPFMTLLAAYATLLHRFSQQDVVLVGTPYANRLRPETRDVIGFFAGSLPLKCDLTGDPTFEALLRRVRQDCLDSFAASEPACEELLVAMPPPAPGRMPVTQAFFTLGEFPEDPIAAGELTLAPFGMNALPFSGFDVVLALREQDGGYSGALLCRRDLFAAETVERFRDGLVELVAGIVAAPGSRISRLPLLPAAERRRIAEEWNATAAPFPEDTCVHAMVERQARATPSAPAVLHQGRAVSYAELDGAATALARRLRARGVGPETLVAVLVERSPEMVVALLAVWKAGGALLPLDPSWPDERKAAVVRDAGAGIALSQRSGATRLAEIAGPGLRVLCVDDVVSEDGVAGDGGARPSNLAYVIYTSGSTGAPKGVMIEHRSVANVVSSFCGTYRVGPEDRVLQQASLAFDVSVNEIFPVLAAGGAVVIPRQDEIADFDRLAALVAAERVTIMAAAPSALAELNRRAPQLAGLRLVLSGGEALSRFDVDRLLRTAVVTNGYGPTEATICATCYDLRQLPPGSPASVPIGRPLPNYRVYVLDREMQLLPVGCPGEVCIAGVGLARGYLKDAELTAARFVANPFEPGGRLYRTGDLARWRADGQLEFLGRLDRQVKVRGCRVELGEVEAALREHPDVQDAVVTPLPDATDGRLAAYIVPHPDRALSLVDVRTRAERRLPAHMRPAAWVLLPELPLTASGKVDVARLPRPQATRPETGVAYVEPSGATEVALARAWAESLGIDRVGRHDSFFDLGGHSLLAAQVIVKLQETLHVAVPYRFFLETPTLEQMALRIDRLKLPSAGIREPAATIVDPLVRFPSVSDGPPIYLVYPPGGGVTEYQHLARELGAHWPVCGLQSRALADWTAEHASWEAMAEDAARTVRRHQAEGPYRLLGFSGGGILALAVARALERDGCQVQIVCLVDSPWGGGEAVVARGAESALVDSMIGVAEGFTPQFAVGFRDLLASSNPFDADFVRATDEERLRRLEDWLSNLPVPTAMADYLRNRLRLYDLHHRLLRDHVPSKIDAPVHSVWAGVPTPGFALPPRHDWGVCSTAGATADSVAAPHWSLLVPPAVSEVAARVVERLRAASHARNHA
ncbi:MAG: amino acid adenylation domain-containing protein [Planctomycetota bacterium]